MKWGTTAMRLKMSYFNRGFNRGILLNDFKRFGWIGAGYLLGLLLSTPLMILMLHSQLQWNANLPMMMGYRNIYLHVLLFNTPQVLLLILVPILTGLWLFQYLQDGRAADTVHALPIRRETLYNTHILSGLVLLSVPLLVTALLTWALIAGLGITQVGGLHVLNWLVLALLFNLLFFTTSAATAMITGMSTVQAVLSLILLLLPSGLVMLLLVNFKMYAYGFAFDYYIYNTELLSPLIRITNIAAIGTGEIAIYLLACVALYLAGLYLYRRRRLETAGDAVTFGVLRPVLKYGVTFCFMMLAGAYFFSSQNGSMGWTYFGYVIGALIAYFLIEILFNKSLHVFHRQSVKGFGVFSLITILIITWLNLGLGGFEQKLPELNQVESVYFSTTFGPLQVRGRPAAVQAQLEYYTSMVPGQAAEQYLPLQMPLPVFQDANSIAGIHELHRRLIENRAEETSAANGGGVAGPTKTSLCLAYNLKNGAHIYRQYYINRSDYETQLKPLYESSEYKYLHNGILQVDPADITMINIEAQQVNKGVRLVDPGLIQQAVAALRSDIGMETYEEMTSNRPGWASIRILLANKRTLDLEWKKSYAGFDQWLESIGEIHNARLTKDDVNYAMVLKRSAAASPWDSGLNQYLLLENNPDFLKITDPEDLEVCLRQFSHLSSYVDQQPYQVVFALKSGSMFTTGFTEADAPAFIREHFASR
jgi:ABC-2 type transport system permease protein